MIPRYTIVAQIFEDEQTLFRLRKAGESGFIEKTAHAISSDLSLVEAMSRRDAYLIGYVSASEKALADMSFVLSRNMVS